MLKQKQKIYQLRRTYQNAYEIAKTSWEGSKYIKLENLTLLTKKIQSLRRNIQNCMFKDSIGIFQGLIEFIEGIIARKINSWIKFRL